MPTEAHLLHDISEISSRMEKYGQPFAGAVLSAHSALLESIDAIIELTVRLVNLFCRYRIKFVNTAQFPPAFLYDGHGPPDAARAFRRRALLPGCARGRSARHPVPCKAGPAVNTAAGPVFMIRCSRCLRYYRRLEARQIFCRSAAAISSSRKSGCAMEMSRSARSQVERPARFTAPYSVTR